MKKYLVILVILLVGCFPSKKHIFLIGDSISIEYGPYLKEYTSDFADMERKENDGLARSNLDVPMGANGGDSRMVLDYLSYKLQEPDFSPDYVLLNCGLHDIKRNPQTYEIQISDLTYCHNLVEIIDLLKKKHIQPIWIRTTWVVDSIHNAKSKAFYRYNADVCYYNKMADSICLKHKIPIIDLYTFTVNQGVEKMRDHVHYISEAQKEQAEFIANELKRYIK